MPRSLELRGTPFFPQEDYQCGPAALATVLRAGGAGGDAESLQPQVYLPARAGSLQRALHRRHRAGLERDPDPVRVGAGGGMGAGGQGQGQCAGNGGGESMQSSQRDLPGLVAARRVRPGARHTPGANISAPADPKPRGYRQQP